MKKIIFGIGDKNFAKDVASQLDLNLAHHTEFYFDDKEPYIRSDVNVRGCDAYVVSSLYSDSQDSICEKLCKLLFFIGSLKDASAERVTLIAPYLGFSRQDRKVISREPITTKYVAKMFESVGVDHLLTIDVHSLGAFQNAYRCRVDNLECKNLLAEYMSKKLADISADDVSVLSPDSGGLGRTRRFRDKLSALMRGEVKIAFYDKMRKGKEIIGSNIIGDVAPTTIVVDDMISSGGTIIKTLEPLKKRGAKRIYVVATHGLFVGDANENLLNPDIHQIIVSDTIEPFRLSETIAKKTEIVSTTGLIAEAIERIYTGESLSSMFN